MRVGTFEATRLDDEMGTTAEMKYSRPLLEMKTTSLAGGFCPAG
jgi:hypothetical protein